MSINGSSNGCGCNDGDSKIATAYEEESAIQLQMNRLTDANCHNKILVEKLFSKLNPVLREQEPMDKNTNGDGDAVRDLRSKFAIELEHREDEINASNDMLKMILERLDL
jgi:hypothetical protein